VGPLPPARSSPVGGVANSSPDILDPDSVNPDPDPDPAFQVNPDPDPGFDSQKIEEKNTGDFFSFFLLLIKKCIYLSAGLHKGRPSYRRSLQHSKENIQHFKTLNF
jgi:hypothetical protein